MGACCCHQKRTTGQRALEEHAPLSSQPGTTAAVPTALLVDTNLDTSTPDTFRPPPLPLPFDVVFGHPQSPPAAEEINGTTKDTGAQTTESDSIPETVGYVSTDVSKSDDLEETDCKVKTNSGVDSTKGTEAGHSNSVNPIGSAMMEEEEDCPICMEEYDADNPKTTTKCEHHYHLACILAWKERSKACPVCDQEMVFDPPLT